MQEYIEIRGARENNLKDVTLKIPKRKITIFTGISGSGKSSLVFDTIAAEAQRLLNENFSMFVRNFLPRISQPEADEIKNLSMAVIVDQKPLGGGSHSTVGTVTDIATALRLMFSRFGKPPELIRRGGPAANDAAAHASRVPGGHPEGYLEAFAQLYTDLAEQISAHLAGRRPDPSSLLVPGVAEGVAGMRFISAAVESSRRNSAWVALLPSAGSRATPPAGSD